MPTVPRKKYALRKVSTTGITFKVIITSTVGPTVNPVIARVK